MSPNKQEPQVVKCRPLYFSHPFIFKIQYLNNFLHLIPNKVVPILWIPNIIIVIIKSLHRRNNHSYHLIISVHCQFSLYKKKGSIMRLPIIHVLRAFRIRVNHPVKMILGPIMALFMFMQRLNIKVKEIRTDTSNELKILCKI